MSSSPPEGGRRARLAAERLARETTLQDGEVLDSRPSRRAANRSAQRMHAQASLPTQAVYAPSESILPTQAGYLPEGYLPEAFLPDQTSLLDPTVYLPGQAAPPTPPGLLSPPAYPVGSEYFPTTEISLPDRAVDPPRSRRELAERSGRRAARPQTARRRAELALGRSFSNRRIWGVALAMTMVLIVPGASMLESSISVTDSDLSGGGSNLAAVQQFPDSTRVEEPDVTESSAAATAKAKAKAAAIAAANAAAKATADAPTKRSTKSETKKAPTTKQPSSGSTGRLNTELSGLGWVSGVFARGQGVDGLKAFGDWRGAAVDVVVDWPARESWDDIVNPDWLYNTWKNTPYTKVFGVAPVPQGDSGATMAGCAAGSYNDKWRQFAANIKAAGLDDESVIRLGWEFNGDWYKWSANDPGQFAECWRQIVSSAESVAPALLWDWNVNRGKGSSVEDARKAYPGDSYVDIVGIDSYDQWPGVTDAVTWAKHYSGPYGLKFWSDFARDHGKKLSVPEWGVYPGPQSSGQNGGDNAFYIAKMQAFFKSEGSHLAYEAYFNESASYIASSLFSPTQNPNAAAKYNSLFGN